MRSSRAWLGLALIGGASAAVVAFVHQQQQEEARKLHEGVIKDAQRIKWRRAELEKERQQQEQSGGTAPSR